MHVLFLLGVVTCFLRALRFQYCRLFPAENSKTIIILGLLAAAATAGFSLGIASRSLVPLSAEMGLPANRIIAVQGILTEDPRSLQGGSGLGTIELRQCAADGGLRATARGSLTVFFPAGSIPRLKEFGRGSEVYLDGIYSSGGSSAGGSSAGRIPGTGSNPLFRASSVHIIKSAPALETFRTGLRITLLDKFQSRHDSTVIWGSLASALLLGIRDNLDTELSGGFRNAGCSHILALSGMHLAIISGILAFLLKRPLGIRRASAAGAVFIVFYVFIAGSQPSLVRAAIMYLIGVFAVWTSLKTNGLSLLSLAFIIQLFYQSGTGDSLSFILSYLALAGILTLGESIREIFRGRLPEIINGSLASSLGAFIITSPVVAFFFGTLRPVGIIAGIFLALLSSIFMVLSLAALIFSFLPLPIWNIFDFILTWIYRFLELLVSVAGRFPGINVKNPLPVLFISILLWVFVLLIQKRERERRNHFASFD